MLPKRCRTPCSCGQSGPGGYRRRPADGHDRTCVRQDVALPSSAGERSHAALRFYCGPRIGRGLSGDLGFLDEWFCRLGHCVPPGAARRIEHLAGVDSARRRLRHALWTPTLHAVTDPGDEVKLAAVWCRPSKETPLVFAYVAQASFDARR